MTIDFLLTEMENSYKLFPHIDLGKITVESVQRWLKALDNGFIYQPMMPVQYVSIDFTIHNLPIFVVDS